MGVDDPDIPGLIQDLVPPPLSPVRDSLSTDHYKPETATHRDCRKIEKCVKISASGYELKCDSLTKATDAPTIENATGLFFTKS